MNQEFNNQVPVQDPMVQQYQQPMAEPPKKSKIGLIIGIVVVIALLGVGAFFLKTKVLDNKQNKEKTNTSEKESNSELERNIDPDSLVIFDTINKGINIYNEKGELLHEGVSRVDRAGLSSYLIRTKDNNTILVDNHGKVLKDFKDYIYITEHDGLIMAQKSDYIKSSFFKTSDGEFVKEEEKPTVIVTETCILLDNELYTADSTLVAKLPEKDNYEENKMYMSENGDYVAIYYYGTNYIYDIKNKKEVISFEDEAGYVVTDYEGNKVALSSANVINPSSNKRAYVYVEAGEKVFEGELPSNTLTVQLTIEGSYLEIYYNSDETHEEYAYLLDTKGNKLLQTRDNTFDIKYKDEKNYVKRYKEGLPELIIDGQKVELDLSPCMVAYVNPEGYIKGDLYQVCDTLYDKNGKPLKNNNNIIIVDETIDSYGNYLVHTKEGAFIINAQGEELVSPSYKKIARKDNGFYLAQYEKDGEKKYDIINTKGEILIKEATSVTSETTGQKESFVCYKKDGKWFLYNVTIEKETYSSTDEISLSTGYFIVLRAGKKEYYTYYNNTKFYEY